MVSTNPSDKSSSHIELLRKLEEHVINDICETEETKKTQITKWAGILEKRIGLSNNLFTNE